LLDCRPAAATASRTDIGHFINEKVQTIPGIQDTRTILTFKAFGK
jgi:DNA-binding Lrp family transcriptional regulator